MTIVLTETQRKVIAKDELSRFMEEKYREIKEFTNRRYLEPELKLNYCLDKIKEIKKEIVNQHLSTDEIDICRQIREIANRLLKKKRINLMIVEGSPNYTKDQCDNDNNLKIDILRIGIPQGKEECCFIARKQCGTYSVTLFIDINIVEYIQII